MSRIAEVMAAFFWICDECGKDNFFRAIVEEMAPEEKERICQDHGLMASEGDFLIPPVCVTCGHCGQEYKTQFHGGES